MAVRINHLSVPAGADRVINCTVDPVENITGWTFAFTVKLRVADTVPLISKTSGSGIEITVAASGTFAVTLTDDDTTLAAKTYVYDIWRTNAGAEDQISYGNFDITDSVR